jgi:hypothetical protein
VKNLLLAALLPGIVLGSTLSATVDCGSGPNNGVPSGSDLLLAQCTGPGGSAMATVTATSVNAGTITNPFSTPFSASAIITAEYQLTIFGSTGPAFFVACVTAMGDRYPGDGSAGASVSFAGGQFAAAQSDTEIGAVSNCDNGLLLEPLYGLPFIFGQPFLIDGTMSAESSSGASAAGGAPFGDAGFSSIVALDSNCAPSCTKSDIIPGTSFTLTLVPEPATCLLVLGALGLMARSLRKPRTGP